MLIPSGTQVRLAKGTLVVITHRLGGNFTVSGSFGMARILEKDADAIGEASKNPQNSETKAEAEENAPSPAPEEKSDRENFAPPEESELWDAARTVYDPEIPLNIVDLGLVYKMDLIHSPDGKYAVEADMTLTAPNCPAADFIMEDVRQKIESIDGVTSATINLVFEPEWDKDMMSEEAKLELGFL